MGLLYLYLYLYYFLSLYFNLCTRWLGCPWRRSSRSPRPRERCTHKPNVDSGARAVQNPDDLQPSVQLIPNQNSNSGQRWLSLALFRRRSALQPTDWRFLVAHITTWGRGAPQNPRNPFPHKKALILTNPQYHNPNQLTSATKNSPPNFSLTPSLLSLFYIKHPFPFSILSPDEFNPSNHPLVQNLTKWSNSIYIHGNTLVKFLCTFT